MQLEQVIKRAIVLSEKGAIMREKDNKYMFVVDLKASARDVKRAIETFYKVSVKQVNTLITRGKDKRMGRGFAKRPNWKKAIVTLKQGESIDFMQEV